MYELKFNGSALYFHSCTKVESRIRGLWFGDLLLFTVNIMEDGYQEKNGCVVEDIIIKYYKKPHAYPKDAPIPNSALKIQTKFRGFVSYNTRDFKIDYNRRRLVVILPTRMMGFFSKLWVKSQEPSMYKVGQPHPRMDLA